MDSFRILVTGSRNWTNKSVVAQAIRQAWLDAGRPYRVIVVHGGARGADYIADVYSKRLGFFTEPHEAEWDVFGRSAGPIRNQEMVDAGADICLAFTMPDSVGTLDCIKRAEKAGIPVRRFEDA